MTWTFYTSEGEEKQASGDPVASVPIEDWHVVGAAGEPAFGAGVAAYGGGFATPAFRKLPDGTVELSGLVNITSATRPLLLFTLPAGYAPVLAPGLTQTVIYPEVIGAAVAEVRISTSGSLYINAPTTLSYLSLDGIRFSTGQATWPTGVKGDQGPPGYTEYGYRNGGWGASTPLSAGVWKTLKPSGTPTIVPSGAFTENADGSVTIQDAGWYDFSASVYISGVASLAAMCISPTLDAVGYIAETGGSGDRGPVLTCSGATYVAAGQKVYVNGYAAAVSNGTYREFTITRVGAGPKGDQGVAGASGAKGDPGGTEYALQTGAGTPTSCTGTSTTWTRLPLGALSQSSTNYADCFTLNADGTVTIKQAGWYSIYHQIVVSTTANSSVAPFGIWVSATDVTPGTSALLAPSRQGVADIAGFLPSHFNTVVYLTANSRIGPSLMNADVSARTWTSSWFSIARLSGAGPAGPAGPAGTVYDSDQIGTVKAFSGATLPTNWQLAAGQALSRVTYAELYAALGGAASPWGQGDGSTTFNVPDLTSKFIYGAGALNAQNVPGGAATATLAQANLPAHTHNPTPDAQYLTVKSGSGTHWAYATATVGPDIGIINWTGNGPGTSTPFSILPPYVKLAQIIKVTGASINPGGALVGPKGDPGTLGPVELYGLRSNFSMNGGGSFTLSTTTKRLLWTGDLVLRAQGIDALVTTNGVFFIGMPPLGTLITGAGGCPDDTVTSEGIAFGDASGVTLWYELPIPTSDGDPEPLNFRRTYTSSTFIPPAHWVMIARTDSTAANPVYGPNGIQLTPGQTQYAVEVVPRGSISDVHASSGLFGYTAGKAMPGLVPAIPLVSTLPTVGLVEGQMVAYQNAAMATAGISWLLRYRSAGGTYKWDFVGGAPLNSMSDAVLRNTQSTTYVAPTGAATITLPLAGVYDIRYDAMLGMDGAAFETAWASYKLGATAPTNAVNDVFGMASIFNNNMQSVSRQYRHTLATAGSAISELFRVTNATRTCNLSNRGLWATPVRLI